MSEEAYEWEGKTAQEMEKVLKNIEKKMLQFQKKADYVGAQTFKQKYLSCKEALLGKNVSNTKTKHEKQTNDLQKSRQNDLYHFNQYWDTKMNQFRNQSKRVLKEMEEKHKKEVVALRMQLEEQLSTKVKESNQLLNLRKMEEQAAKQKNYVQAHRIQQKANEVYGNEFRNWMDARQNKIQTSIKNLNNRQDAQILNFNRKLQDSLDDLSKDRHLEDQGINQKYDNLMKELRANHEREILSWFGQLRNLGGKSPQKKPRISPS